MGIRVNVVGLQKLGRGLGVDLNAFKVCNAFKHGAGYSLPEYSGRCLTEEPINRGLLRARSRSSPHPSRTWSSQNHPRMLFEYGTAVPVRCSENIEVIGDHGPMLTSWC